MNIPIGVLGKIRNGEHADMRVRIEDDSLNTGGYLVYQWWKNSEGPNAEGAFDDWVESQKQLEEYFEAKGWSIDWEHSIPDETRA
jgi:hypothetical protein